MSIEVNGVTLPDIPSDVLASYPYACILEVTLEETGVNDGYTLLFANAPMYTAEYDGAFPLVILNDTPVWSAYMCDAGDETWTVAMDGLEAAESPYYEGSNGTYYQKNIWANHDICYVAFDENENIVPTTDAWFPSSVSDPNYYAPKSWYDGMAQQVMRLTGTSDKLTTDEMLEALKALELTGGDAEMFLVKTTGVLDASVGQLTIDHTPAEMIEAHNGGQTVLFELTPETLSALYGVTMTESFILRPCAFNSDGSYFQFQGVGANKHDTGTTTFTVTSVTCYVNNSAGAYCVMDNVAASGYITD